MTSYLTKYGDMINMHSKSDRVEENCDILARHCQIIIKMRHARQIASVRSVNTLTKSENMVHPLPLYKRSSGAILKLIKLAIHFAMQVHYKM